MPMDSLTKRGLRHWCMALALLLAGWFTPVLAVETKDIHDVGDSVFFDLPQSASFAEYWLRLPGPGLLEVVETPQSAESLQSGPPQQSNYQIEVILSDKMGMLLGKGGARVAHWQDVRVTVKRTDSGKSQAKGHLKFLFWRPDTDMFEPNNSGDKAFALALSEQTPLSGGAVSLFPDGDKDFFQLDINSEGYVTPHLSPQRSPRHDARIILRDEDGKSWDWGTGRLLAKGRYILELSSNIPDALPSQLRFDFARNWDQCEPNDTMETSCDLSDGAERLITLFPENDRDWFSFKTDKPGVIILSLSGLPATARNANKNLLKGLDLQVTTTRLSAAPNMNRPRARVTHGSIFITAPVAGLYKFALHGNWRASTPQRTIGLRARFFDASRKPDKNSRFLMFGVYGTSRNNAGIELELSVLAGLTNGTYIPVSKPGDIKNSLTRLLGLKKPQASIAPALIVPAKPDKISPLEAFRQKTARRSRQQRHVKTPTLSEDDKELIRLNSLETFLLATKKAHLWRHHYQLSTGKIVRRLEKAQMPEWANRKLNVTKSEKLSSVMSNRLLARAIQSLE